MATQQDPEHPSSEVEGWYTDPFGRHEARWFSAGAPTKLVRDGTAESYDPPPDEPFAHQPEPIEPRYPGDSDRPSAPPAEPDPYEVTREIIKIETFPTFGDR